MGRRKTLAVVIDEAEPIQGELTERQQAFVDAYVDCGGNAKAAAIAAGYSEASARTLGPKLIANPLVAQAVYGAMMVQFARLAPSALMSMQRLSQSAKSELVKMQASADLLDRAGFKPIDRRQVALQGDIRVEIDLG